MKKSKILSEYSFVSNKHKCKNCGKLIRITPVSSKGFAEYIWECTGVNCGAKVKAGIDYPSWVELV